MDVLRLLNGPHRLLDSRIEVEITHGRYVGHRNDRY
jgi:hypothetical protein